MKRKIILCILSLCILITPISAFAYEIDASSISDSLYNTGQIAEKPKITLEYDKAAQNKNENAPETGCKAVYIADPVSGKVFYEKNAHKKMYPASTTNILTALVVLENCKVDEKATVSRRAINLIPEGYSNAKLVAGEKLSVYTLLEALLIPSANEAANVLAEHVSGSVEKFAKLCNKRAKELGCEKLHFVNPNGIHNAQHYCTAYDLYLVAKECKKYEAFNKIVTTQSFTIPPDKFYTKNDRTFQNRNELIIHGARHYYPYCNGIKTGHTDAAGQCLVSSATKDNLDLICVVLGGHKIRGINQRFSDSKKLFQFVYDNYSYKLITNKNEPVKQLKIENATGDTAALDVIIQEDIRAVVPKGFDADKIEAQVNLKEDIKAPLKENEVVGSVSYKIDGLTYSTNLVASHDVKKQPYWILNILVAIIAISFVVFVIMMIDIAIRKRKYKKEIKKKKNYTNE